MRRAEVDTPECSEAKANEIGTTVTAIS